MKIEHRVRPVTRYIVTRYHEDGKAAGVSEKGEYDNRQVAHDVAYALCRQEHEQLGYELGDERIIYPVPFQEGMSVPEGTNTRRD